MARTPLAVVVVRCKAKRHNVSTNRVLLLLRGPPSDERATVRLVRRRRRLLLLLLLLVRNSMCRWVCQSEGLRGLESHCVPLLLLVGDGGAVVRKPELRTQPLFFSTFHDVCPEPVLVN